MASLPCSGNRRLQRLGREVQRLVPGHGHEGLDAAPACRRCARTLEIATADTRPIDAAARILGIQQGLTDGRRIRVALCRPDCGHTSVADLGDVVAPVGAGREVCRSRVHGCRNLFLSKPAMVFGTASRTVTLVARPATTMTEGCNWLEASARWHRAVG